MILPRKKKGRPKGVSNAMLYLQENKYAKMIPDTDVLSKFTEYLTYRNQFLRILKNNQGKPYLFKGYIGPHLVKMLDEGLVIQIADFFQITPKGNKCLG